MTHLRRVTALDPAGKNEFHGAGPSLKLAPDPVNTARLT